MLDKVQRLHGDLARPGRLDGGAGTLQRRTKLRPPAAPCAHRARRGDALRRGRQAGHDLLGLHRRRQPARRLSRQPAGRRRGPPSRDRRRSWSRRLPSLAGGTAHELVAVAAAGAAPAADAGAARLAGAALPAAPRALSRSRSPRTGAQPVRAPAARAAADARRHAAAGQREPAARTGAPHRRSGAARRRLRGRHRRTGRRDRGRRRRARRSSAAPARNRCPPPGVNVADKADDKGGAKGPDEQNKDKAPARRTSRQERRQRRTSPSRWSCRRRPSRSRISPS